MGSRKPYPDEFKQEAVRLVTEQACPGFVADRGRYNAHVVALGKLIAVEWLCHSIASRSPSSPRLLA